MAFRGCSSDSKTMFSCNCSYLLLCLQENFKNFQPLVLLKSEDFRGRGGGVHSVLQLLPCGHVSAKACSGSGSTCPFHTWEVLFTVILSLDCLHSSLSSLSLFLSVLSSLTLSLSWCHLPCHYLSRGSCLMGYTWPRKDKNCQNFKPSLANIPAPLFWLVCLAQPTQSTSLGTLQCWTIKSQVCFFSGKSEAEDGNTSDGP